MADHRAAMVDAVVDLEDVGVMVAAATAVDPAAMAVDPEVMAAVRGATVVRAAPPTRLQGVRAAMAAAHPATATFPTTTVMIEGTGLQCNSIRSRKNFLSL